MAQLRTLFDDMDGAYGRVADRYGFHCRGCEENCCLTRFHHHTAAEYLFLLEGFRELPGPERRSMGARAEAVLEKTADAERKEAPVRIMCPANTEGLCRLYAHRPMICRLHGLPHELRRPGGAPTYGPGCDRFIEATRGKDYIPFDRTPFYMEMARIEKALRSSLGVTGRIRMTVAEMIRSFPTP